MKSKTILLTTLTIVILASCQENSIDTLDYYFPLNELKSSRVYEYSKTTVSEHGSETSKYYYRLSRIDQNRFSLVTISDVLVTRDSTIIELSDSGIKVSKAYISINGSFVESDKENQLLYPYSIKARDVFSMAETYSGQIDWPPYDKLSINLTATISDFTSESFRVELQEDILYHSTKYTDRFELNFKSTLTNTKGIGLTERITQGEDFSEKATLVKVWNEEEWEKLHTSKAINHVAPRHAS